MSVSRLEVGFLAWSALRLPPGGTSPPPGYAFGCLQSRSPNRRWTSDGGQSFRGSKS